MPNPNSVVEFWLPDGTDPVSIANAGEQLAFYWAHVVRSRGRWRFDTPAREALLREVRVRFEALGVTPSVLRRIAKAGAVEISITYSDSEDSWAPRIVPWEFLLDELTREFRTSGQMLLVIRRLDRKSKARPAQPGTFVFVENNPAPFVRHYSYESEATVVCKQLQQREDVRLANPTNASLREYVASHKPAIIHIAGVDAHQGREILSAWGEPIPSSFERSDGLIMHAGGSGWESVNETALADALTNGGKHAPDLVSFNTYNSGARLAPIVVAAGAKAAIGFYDTFDDALAEKFFAIFYQRLRLGGYRVGAAFNDALQEMRLGTSPGGAYIVLWTAHSVITELAVDKTELVRRKSDYCSDRLFVSVLPVSRVNYARLQAKEPLFTRFNVIRLDRDGDLSLQVEAKLFVGADTFPYRRQVTLRSDQTVLDLSGEIQLPLLSSLQRSLREGVRTLVQYSIKRTDADDFAIDETKPLELSAVNEWWWDPRDDSKYLASFIFPNDPAVLEIIDAAQKYLRALRDDYTSGFDGYQSVSPDLDEPSWGVDQQVRAIWAVLSFDISLHYINPPPVFSEASQRLRSPREVVRGHRGTCIDLALLLAACLEFAEIYPVIFVLKDHAFPGYWRSPADRDSFHGMRDDPGGERSELGDVVKYVASGKLIPLETVLLTHHAGFDTAVNACSDSLADESRWGRLLDVKTARTLGATPIPILETER